MGSKGPRHGRVTVGSKSAYRNWGGRPSRAGEFREATQETPPAAPARKDRRRWCKGRPGVDHVPRIVVVADRLYVTACGWAPKEIWRSAEVTWKCRHREECAICGKVLRETRELRREECPQWPGTPQQRAGAEIQAEKQRGEFQVRSRRFRRKPTITGPQGFRRKREV